MNTSAAQQWPIAKLTQLPMTDASVRHAGNAPTLMAMKDLRKVAPMWVNVSHAIFDDKEAHEACTPDP